MPDLKLKCELCSYTTYNMRELVGHKANEHFDEKPSDLPKPEMPVAARGKKLIVGFDYYNTLTGYPYIFGAFSRIVHELGGQIIIITAVSDHQNLKQYEQSVTDFMDNYEIHYDEVVVIPFALPLEIPALKLKAAQTYHVTHFFDDRRDVIDHLNSFGIKSTRVPVVPGIKHTK